MNSADFLREVAKADALRDGGALQEALALCRDLVAAFPDMALGHYKLGTVMMRLLRSRDAELAFRRAIALRPDYAEAYNNLGLVLVDQGELVAAEQQYRQALICAADHIGALTNLTSLLLRMSRPAEALALASSFGQSPSCSFAEYWKLIELLVYWRLEFDAARLLVAAMNRMPEAQMPDRQGMAKAARLFAETACFDGIRIVGDVLDCVAQVPGLELKAYLLRMLTFAWSVEENAQLMRLYRRFDEALERDVRSAGTLLDSQSRLGSAEIVVGFLGSLFLFNSTAKFLLPVLPHLRDRGFRLVYYSSIEHDPEDAVQHNVVGVMDEVRWVSKLSPAEVAREVFNDRCTILVDLDGYSRWSKTEAFVCRPAPVQVSWINWPSTLGLKSADYFLGSRAMIPTDPGLMSERPIAMDTPYGCFAPQIAADIDPRPPCLANGYVTFGNTGNPYKFSSRLIQLWSAAMNRVPGSRFRLIRHECAHDAFCESVAREFLRFGVETERLEFIALPEGVNHLEAYNLLDICLDTAPYSGATTAAECLWMGVPMICLIGPGLHQRLSYGILNAIGLDELACSSEMQYIDCAADLAADHQRIHRYRTSLRDRFKASPLCDAALVADEVVRSFNFALDDTRRRNPVPARGQPSGSGQAMD